MLSFLSVMFVERCHSRFVWLPHKMEGEKEQTPKKRGFAFFNLTNERVVDLLSYSKYLYYIGMIETILYTLSIIGIPLIGFTLMATTFNDSPCLDKVNIARHYTTPHA